MDKYGKATAAVVSQTALDSNETVYNFEVHEFSTYHIGEMGIWVHNADCCDLLQVNKVHPQTENKILASVSNPSKLDDLVSSSKPSSQSIISKNNTHYYEDPGHHNPNGGNNTYKSNKSVLPANHIELFKSSREYNGVRYSKDAKGNIHQFQDSLGDGSAFHWAGQQNGKTLNGKTMSLTVPPEVSKNDFWK